MEKFEFGVEVKEVPQINVKIEDIQPITLMLSDIKIEPVINEVNTDNIQEYEGSYSVLPLPSSQTLPTADRYCTDDIQVREIPFYKVSNTGGGTTVIIDRNRP